MVLLCWSIIFFFFKQKTAYEMRISDWSSDVCSSDLITCAVLASAALATPAFAQDEADKGMYFQLRTGVADLNNPDFAIIDTWSEPNNRLDTKLNTKSAATFGGELGYDFGGVRVGLELAYQRNKV